MIDRDVTPGQPEPATHLRGCLEPAETLSAPGEIGQIRKADVMQDCLRTDLPVDGERSNLGLEGVPVARPRQCVQPADAVTHDAVAIETVE